MGKIRKNKTKKNRVNPYDNDNGMTDVVNASATTISKEETLQDVNDIVGLEETSHALFKRQSAEWKKMKAEVALLKKTKAKLRNKVITEREQKKTISKRIKDMVLTLRNKHLEEAKRLGIEKSSALDEEAEAMMKD